MNCVSKVLFPGLEGGKIVGLWPSFSSTRIVLLLYNLYTSVLNKRLIKKKKFLQKYLKVNFRSIAVKIGAGDQKPGLAAWDDYIS